MGKGDAKHIGEQHYFGNPPSHPRARRARRTGRSVTHSPRASFATHAPARAPGPGWASALAQQSRRLAAPAVPPPAAAAGSPPRSRLEPNTCAAQSEPEGGARGPGRRVRPASFQPPHLAGATMDSASVPASQASVCGVDGSGCPRKRETVPLEKPQKSAQMDAGPCV